MLKHEKEVSKASFDNKLSFMNDTLGVGSGAPEAIKNIERDVSAKQHILPCGEKYRVSGSESIRIFLIFGIRELQKRFDYHD